MVHEVKEQQASVAVAERKPLLRQAAPQATASALQPRRVLVKGSARRDLKENAVAAVPPFSPVGQQARRVLVKASTRQDLKENAVAAVPPSSPVVLPSRLAAVKAFPQLQRHEKAKEGRVLHGIAKECHNTADGSSEQSSDGGYKQQKPHSICKGALLVSSTYSTPIKPLFGTPSRFQTASSRIAASDKVSENDKECPESDAPSSTTKSAFSGRVPLSILLQRHNSLLNAAISPAGAPCSPASPSRFQTPFSRIAAADKASENNKECLHSDAPSSTTKSAFSGRVPLAIHLQRHSSLLNAAAPRAGALCSPAPPSRFQTPSKISVSDKASENDKECPESAAPSSTTKSAFSGRVPLAIHLQRHNSLFNAATPPAGAPCSLASPSRFQTPSSKFAVSDKASENDKESQESAAPSSTTKSAFSGRLPLSVLLQRHNSLLNAASSPAGAQCSPPSPSGFAKRALILPQISSPARRVLVHDKSSKKSERKTSIFATPKTSSVDGRKPCTDENLHDAKKNLEGLLMQARTPKRVAVAEAVASSSRRSCRTGRQKLSRENKDQKV